MALTVNTPGAAFQNEPGLFGDPKGFGILREHFDIPHDRLQGCAQLMGNRADNAMTPFVILSDPFFQDILFSNIYEVDEYGGYPFLFYPGKKQFCKPGFTGFCKNSEIGLIGEW
jgi:hypothetical protein